MVEQGNQPQPGVQGASQGPMDVDALRLADLGRSGLHQYGGYVWEERHPKLAGPRAVQVFREMSDNDATVGAVLYTIESLLRNVQFRYEPAGQSPAALEAKLFADQCMEDMEYTWEETLSEILSCLPYGWAAMEKVYKIRRGPAQEAPEYQSRFNDGKIGIRKLELRAQDTLLRWEFDTTGHLQGMWQQSPPDYQLIYLPLTKLSVFRPKAPRNNPEGRSILRNAYRSWAMLRRLQEIEAIGIERDLAGYPVMEVPVEFTSPTANASQKQQLAGWAKILQQTRRDEREGAVIPAEEYSVLAGGTVQNFKSGYRLRLLSTGGRRAIDTNAIIRRWQTDIMIATLTDFLMLGTGPTGSFALADSKTEMLAESLGGQLDTIAATWNRTVTKPLMQMNGYAPEAWPKLVHGDIKTPDLDKLGNFLLRVQQAGMLTPDDRVERKVREVVNFPEKDDAGDVVQNVPPPSADPGEAADDAARGAQRPGAAPQVQQQPGA